MRVGDIVIYRRALGDSHHRDLPMIVTNVHEDGSLDGVALSAASKPARRVRKAEQGDRPGQWLPRDGETQTRPEMPSGGKTPFQLADPDPDSETDSETDTNTDTDPDPDPDADTDETKE